MAIQTETRPYNPIMVSTDPWAKHLAESSIHVGIDYGVEADQAKVKDADPHGKKANESGAKLDLGKIRAGLVLLAFSRALMEVSKVGTFGANKYVDNGWIDVPNGEQRYTDALLRHMLAEASGEHVDEESGLSHAAHAAWNALARLDLVIRAQERNVPSRGSK